MELRENYGDIMLFWQKTATKNVTVHVVDKIQATLGRLLLEASGIKEDLGALLSFGVVLVRFGTVKFV